MAVNSDESLQIKSQSHETSGTSVARFWSQAIAWRVQPLSSRILMALVAPSALLDEAEKLLCGGDRVSDEILAIDLERDDRNVSP